MLLHCRLFVSSFVGENDSLSKCPEHKRHGGLEAKEKVVYIQH